MPNKMMGGGPMMMGAADTPAPTSDEGNESPSIFLSREMLGGKEVKAGDSLTLLVRDVDPETGDVQAELSGGGETPEAEGGISQDFDNAMPEDLQEGY